MAQLNVVIGDDKIQLNGTAAGTMTPNKANQMATGNADKGVSVAQSKAFAIGANIAMQSFNYAKSNVGKWTGNSQNQRTVDNLSQLVSTGMAFAINPMLGAASLAVNIGTRAIDEQWRLQMEQKNLSQLRARNGYTDTKSILTSRRH